MPIHIKGKSIDKEKPPGVWPSPPLKEGAELIEELAEFKHDEETNSFQRRSYAHLSEDVKEEYREWARKVLTIVKEYKG